MKSTGGMEEVNATLQTAPHWPQAATPRAFLEAMADADSLMEYSDIVRKVFSSEDEGFEFYNEYAYEKGFSVRKEYCEWDNGHNERTLQRFVCSCQGFVCSCQGFRHAKELNRENKQQRPWNLTRCGCRAQLLIAQDHKIRTGLQAQVSAKMAELYP